MRQILEHLPYFAALIDGERRCLWVNRLNETLTLEQVIGQQVETFIHPGERQRVVIAIERALATGRLERCENRGYSQGQVESWYATTVVPLVGEQGDGARALMLCVDVTERYLAEKALRDSERRFRMLTEALPDLIAIVDREQRVTYVNRDPSVEAGIAPDALLGKRIAKLCHPEDVAVATQAVQRALDHGEAGRFEARAAYNGRTFVNRVIRLSSEDDEAQALIAATDVTEQRLAEVQRLALEAQLQQAQKLESVGQLAGGVAHDFNNVLLVIQGHLEFATAAVQAGADPMPELRAIAAAAERASSMTERLLTIGRRQPYKPSHFDLAQLARDTLNLLERMMPESITIAFEARARPAPVLADPAQLEQVLINLCLNARDAIVGVGRIRVRVAEADAMPGCGDGPWLSLSVADTGTGMDQATAARVFEPFFTTKPPGKGTGLGLSMVHSIIAENGGLVDLKTAVGQGSTFTILLPRAGVAPAERPPSTPSLPLHPGRPGKILVAEDEVSVREIVVGILRRAGYEVVEAAHGEQAVALFRASPASFDLVLLDAVMPVLGGKEAYEEIARIRPDVKALFSSGYSTEALPSPFLQAHKLVVLPKPYRPAALLRAIRQVLASVD